MLGILPAAIMALSLTGYITNAQLENLDRSFQDWGHTIADEAALLSAYGGFSGNIETLKNVLRSIMEHSGVVSILVQGADEQKIVYLERDPGLSGEGTGNAVGKIVSFTAPVNLVLSRRCIICPSYGIFASRYRISHRPVDRPAFAQRAATHHPQQPDDAAVGASDNRHYRHSFKPTCDQTVVTPDPIRDPYETRRFLGQGSGRVSGRTPHAGRGIQCDGQ